jgi:sarcosine oxidase subunit beta
MQKYDVAVIGGGLIGCASAYYLSKSGASVALIEAGQINQGASGQNAGSLHFQLEQRFFNSKEHGAGILAEQIVLAQIAIEQWRGLEEELNCDLELLLDGGFMVAETADDIKRLEEKSKIENSQGLNVHLLGHEEIHKLAPYLGPSVEAALFCPDEGHCNPRLLTPAFAKRAQALDTDILTNTKVKGIHFQQGKWQIEFTSNQSRDKKKLVTTNAILNTAGAWAGEIGMMVDFNLPLQPLGLIMNVTEKVPPFVNHLIQHAGRRLSMKQVDDGNLLIGGGWPAKLQQKDGLWLSDKPALVSTDAIRNNLRVATDIAPFIKDLNLIRSWSGIIAIAPDQLPVLGEIPHAPGFYVATGGNGFTYGPTYAHLISELILNGSTSFPLEPYAPNRFS